MSVKICLAAAHFFTSKTSVGGACKLLCDVSTGAGQTSSAIGLKVTSLPEHAQYCAPGQGRVTSSQVAASFVWPHMVTNVNGWCKWCMECARSKVMQNVHMPLQPIPIPVRRFSHIHMDLVGPLPVSMEGFAHLSPWWTPQ
jgi:hypothetical protein